MKHHWLKWHDKNICKFLWITICFWIFVNCTHECVNCHIFRKSIVVPSDHCTTDDETPLAEVKQKLNAVEKRCVKRCDPTKYLQVVVKCEHFFLSYFQEEQQNKTNICDLLCFVRKCIFLTFSGRASLFLLKITPHMIQHWKWQDSGKNSWNSWNFSNKSAMNCEAYCNWHNWLQNVTDWKRCWRRRYCLAGEQGRQGQHLMFTCFVEKTNCLQSRM